MPYCCQCGQTVGSQDVYCAGCGTRQATTAAPPPPPGLASAPGDFMQGVSPRLASLLCYVPILGWIFAIVVLASARFRGDTRVRFNAFQGIYLFVAWLIVDRVLSPMFSFPHMWGPSFYKIVPVMMKAAIFGAWVFMIIKTSQDELFKLPILGELAEKSVSEQR